MIYQTPDWPYDLTEKQQKQEESALNQEINITCTQMIPRLTEQVEELVKTAERD